MLQLFSNSKSEKKGSFKGGIHPDYHKDRTRELPITPLVPPEILYIPLSQHIGKPAVPIVKKGDRVLLGQKLGEADGHMSVPVHSSVSGTVVDITSWPSIGGMEVPTVIIENDFRDEPVSAPAEPRDVFAMTSAELLAAVKDAGIVGMGGAAFPTHVKLAPPAGKSIDTFIINGAECEPYLTADERIFIEQADRVLLGARICAKILNVQNIIVAIEDNKPESIERMRQVAEGIPGVRVQVVKTKYPQGCEKQLIEACTGRQVPKGGGLPMDCGVVALNAGSATAVADACERAIPLYQRVVTISGDGFPQAANLMIRIGTPFSYVIKKMNGHLDDIRKVISGGPMMGKSQYDTRVPVVKGTSGILLFSERQAYIWREDPCIHCGKCASVCPMHLMPLRICNASRSRNFEACLKLNIMECMECGCCTYICPAGRKIIQSIQAGKSEIKAIRAAEQAKKAAEAKKKEEVQA